MKAIVIHKLGDVSNLSYEVVPDPIPGPGEVLINLKAAAVNRRDLSLRKRKTTQKMLPLIPGTDGAGVIAGLGPGVKGWSVDQPVMINPALNWGNSPHRPGSEFRILGGPDQGTYAQMVVVPAENVYPKPENLTFPEAAACPVGMVTAWRALVTLAALQPGDRLLIPGIGSGVATFALQIARRAGAIVFVTSHSDEKIRLALSLGANGGANYECETWKEEIWEMMGGGGVDVVLDSVGTSTFGAGLALLAVGGRLVTFGATAGAQVELDLRQVYHRHIQIIGTTLGSPWEFEGLLRPLASGAIKPVIDSIFPLTQASDAQRRLESGLQFGKIVLEIE